MQVKENEGLRFLCSKAEVIDEIETTVPQWVKDRNPGWYPAFVHVLKVGSPFTPSLLCVNTIMVVIIITITIIIIMIIIIVLTITITIIVMTL